MISVDAGHAANALDLESHWMPFTANTRFKKAPRLVERADGLYYHTLDGRRLLDGIAGLWCVNVGHCHPKVVEAIRAQAGHLDYAPCFQFGHPRAFDLAARVAALAPGDLSRVFFANSGSEAVDTALKMALAYHRTRGEGQRNRFIGRSRSYHGMGFGGLTVSGIAAHRRDFGPLLPGAAHLPDTHDLPRNAFSRGQPDCGIDFADRLEELVRIYDASTIAAVIVEPVAGSNGVLIPPKGYLERLREICTKHGILLIFDEVITGFGRLGASFAASRFNVIPDMITIAKGLTNGAVPMGGVIAREPLYAGFMEAKAGSIEFMHGYTYSGHPLAAAAGLATLDVYRDEGVFAHVAEIESYWEERAHALAGRPHVIDIRNFGLMAAIELRPRDGAAGARAGECQNICFENGVIVRANADNILLSPPLVITHAEIDVIFDAIAAALAKIG